MRTAKALARLRGCAGSPEPSLVAYVFSTIISWTGNFVFSGSFGCHTEEDYILFLISVLELNFVQEIKVSPL